YVAGTTDSGLGGASAGDYDAFVAKYDPAGNALWIRQFGTSGDDGPCGVAVDAAGNVYVAGFTSGNLGGASAGDYDAFVAKYDAAGSAFWTRQFGTSDYDDAHGVAVDAAGNVYVAGSTSGSLGGASAGYDDAFVVRLSRENTPPVASAGGPYTMREGD